MSDWDDVTGFKMVSGMNGTSGNHSVAVKIFVQIDRELTDADKKVIWRARETITDQLYRDSLRLDPAEQLAAVRERADILALFPDPIFVETVPNGYCSRYCCAHKPWFVVTTRAGRIKIGWRKSVIHLEWTDSAVTKKAAEIFPKEEAWPGYETTQYDKVIHAHGYDKAREYIARIIASCDAEQQIVQPTTADSAVEGRPA